MKIFLITKILIVLTKNKLIKTYYTNSEGPFVVVTMELGSSQLF